MIIPVMPLAIFLLPLGITRLRIFEQRYLNMVKVASKENGFAILLHDKSDIDEPIASWVEIIDFDKTDEGILQIDVQCKSLVRVNNPSVDKNQLMWAGTEILPHWPVQSNDDTSLRLSHLLRMLFEENIDLFTLYGKNFVDKPAWVTARWLELLPIKNKEKAHFFLSNSYQQANSFLADLLIEKNKTQIK
jgi:Lon protease-like protein